MNRIKTVLWVIAALALAPAAARADEPSLLERGQESLTRIGSSLAATRKARAESDGLAVANYSLIDTWMPSKFGLSLA